MKTFNKVRPAYGILLGVIIGVGISLGLALLQNTAIPDDTILPSQFTLYYLKRDINDVHEIDSRLILESHESVDLPHRWKTTLTPVHHAVYSTTIDLQTIQSELVGIYIPRHQSSLKIFINNQLIGKTGSFSPRITRNWRTPYYFSFNKHLIGNDRNIELTIVQGSSYQNRGSLSNIYINSQEQLEPILKRHYFISNALVEIEATVLLFIGLTFFVFYLRDKVKVYLFFSYACISWSCYNFFMLSTINPIDNPWLMGSLMELSMCWFSFLSLKSNHAILAISRPRFERFFFYIAIFYTALILNNALTNGVIKYLSNYFAFALYIISISYHSYLFFSSTRKFNLLENTAVFTVISLFSILALNDNLILINKSVLYDYQSHNAAFIYLIVFSMLVILRAQKNKFASMTKKRGNKISKAVSSEKARIKADLHDGVAGRLTAILHSIRMNTYDDTSLEADLQIALSELRMTFKKEDYSSTNVVESISGFKQDIHRILLSCHINNTFNIDIPLHIHLSKPKINNLMKIVYEATTNIIKHSKAHNATFLFKIHGESLVVIIIDDGVGFNPEDKYTGFGTKNILARCKLLKATIEVSSDKGTSIKIQVPINSKTETE